MTARRLALTTLVWLCAVAGLPALWGAVAQATVTHEYLFQFSEVPTEGPLHEPVALPGPVTSLESMTVDSGHVWMAEHMEGGNNFRVDQFSAATGGFLAQPLHSGSHEYLGVAVGHLVGEPEPEVYTGEYIHEGLGVVGVYSASGANQATWTGAETPAKSLGVVFDVAVDNSASLADWAAGDVYVPVPGQNVVDVFKPVAGGTEKYVTQLTGTCATPASCTEDTFTKPRQVAVNSANGDVLVGDGSVVDVFEPTVLGGYAFVRQLTGTPAGSFKEAAVVGGVGVAVDGGNGDIYVMEEQDVDQFSSEGVYRGHLIGTPAGPFSGHLSSVAVDPVSHDVYVGDHREEFGEVVSAVDVFGPGIVVPDVATEPASGVRPGSATLNGTVNPNKAGAATCQFDYGTTRSFGQVAPCSEGVAEGESPVPVHEELKGLQPDTTYFYRLQASNANGTNPGEPSQDQQFTTPGPGIHGESASVVTSDSATLNATLDPHGAPTSYYFQYGTSASYETSVPAPPGLGLGAGEGDLSVGVHVQGLAAGTTYHYRVVVVGEPGGEPVTVQGPDRTFMTQAAGNQFALPDGRAWEMVTPPYKQGAGLLPVGSLGGGDIQASESGGAITYVANSPFAADPAGAHSPDVTQVYSTRNAPGSWGTQDIATPHEEGALGPEIGNPTEYKLFSSDLSLGLVEPLGRTPLPPLPPGSRKTMYLRNTNGEYEALLTSANEPPGIISEGDGKFEGGFHFASATPDLSHVVIGANVVVPREAGLYEWAAGQLQVASVLPNGEVVKYAGLGYGSAGFGGGLVRRAISSDGSRLVWHGQEGEGGDRLYLRDMARGETVQVDAAQGAPEAPAESTYRGADSTGSRVFFTNRARLTADARISEGQQEGSKEDLYEFEVTSGKGEPLAGKLTDLTVDLNAHEVADVRGVIEASEDGSSVYFVANGVLGDGAEHGAKRGDCELGGETLESNQLATCNLYVERYDTGSKTWERPTFIAALSGADGRSWGGGLDSERENLTKMTSRVSPNGRYLAFMSDRSLTGYDNRDVSSGMPDEEVFLYDASAGRMVCASCNPTGARPVGLFEGEQVNERLIDPVGGGPGNWIDHWLAGSIPGWTPRDLSSALYQSRYLSNSGRLFFNGNDALVPADVNGREDVYEYEPAGVGGCQGPGYGQSASVVFSKSVGGCVGLISAGTSAEESVFMDASESGGDVFFLTLSRLASQDYDTSIDLYDAHECVSSSPCASPPDVVPPPCVTGDACKAAPSPQPTIFGSPSSATFSGAGNITAPVSKPTSRSRKAVKCRRGFVKKHGRCAKKKAKRASRPARRGK
jgi:hypothetical protein